MASDWWLRPFCGFLHLENLRTTVPWSRRLNEFMLEHVLESFLMTLKQEDGRAEHTLSTYSAQILPFIRWLNEQAVTKPNEIKLTHVRAYLESERTRDKASPGSKPGEKNSSATMAVKGAAIGGFLRHCVNEGHMTEVLTYFL